MITITTQTVDLVPRMQLTKARLGQAVSMAGSSGLRAMRAEAARQIRSKKAIKLARVNSALTPILPGAGEMVWRLKASAAPMPVIYFNARQNRQGVLAEINLGKRTLIRSAFIARMRSGHVGVFYRTGDKGRRDKPYLEKIDEAYSTRISEVFADCADDILDRGVSVFEATFHRLTAAR